MDDKRRILKGLRRVRALLCRFQRTEEEVPTCSCVLGGMDAGADHGAQTGCKEIYAAIQEIENESND